MLVFDASRSSDAQMSHVSERSVLEPAEFGFDFMTPFVVRADGSVGRTGCQF